MPKPRKPDVAGAVTAITEAQAIGRGRKSPVYLWLRERHDELQAAFELNAPSWSALAEYLGKGGIMSGNGTPPTATSVQNSWVRVRKSVKTSREKQRPSPPVAEAKKPQPAAPDYLTPEPELDPEQEFPVRFAKLRKHPPQKPPEDK